MTNRFEQKQRTREQICQKTSERRNYSKISTLCKFRFFFFFFRVWPRKMILRQFVENYSRWETLPILAETVVTTPLVFYVSNVSKTLNIKIAGKTFSLRFHEKFDFSRENLNSRIILQVRVISLLFYNNWFHKPSKMNFPGNFFPWSYRFVS